MAVAEFTQHTVQVRPHSPSHCCDTHKTYCVFEPYLPLDATVENYMFFGVQTYVFTEIIFINAAQVTFIYSILTRIVLFFESGLSMGDPNT